MRPSGARRAAVPRSRRRRRGKQPLGNRLGEHRIERIAQRRALRAKVGDARGKLGIAGERRLDDRDPLGRKLPVRERVEIVVGDRVGRRRAHDSRLMLI